MGLTSFRAEIVIMECGLGTADSRYRTALGRAFLLTNRQLRFKLAGANGL